MSVPSVIVSNYYIIFGAKYRSRELFEEKYLEILELLRNLGRINRREETLAKHKCLTKMKRFVINGKMEKVVWMKFQRENIKFTYGFRKF